MANKYEYSFKVLILGDSSVGKTCILLRFAEDSFSTQHVTTIGVDFRLKIVEIDGKLIKLQLWDTAGQERFRTITKAYYKGSHGILLTYDVTNRESFKNVTHWIKQIDSSGVGDLVKVLVGNKCDLPNREVSEEEGRKLAENYGIPFIETSAKNNINIEQAFNTLTGEMLKTAKVRGKTMKNTCELRADNNKTEKKKCMI